jgi:regulator of replication initiation timing
MIIAAIEKGMWHLSRFNFDIVSNYYPFILGFSFLLLYLSVRSSEQTPNSLFAGLDIAQKDKELVVKKYAHYVEFKNVNPKVLAKAYWQDQLEVLGNILNSKFIDVLIVPGRRPAVRLFHDLLPSLLPFSDCPTLNPMETWAGKNQFNKDVIINLQDTPAIYLDGKAGSGKTIALLSLLDGYLNGIKAKVEVTIVTTKPADFFHLKRREEISLNLIDPFEGDFSSRIGDILSDFSKIKDIETHFKKTIEENETINLESMNLEALRRPGIYEGTDRKFYIFDEAKDYLSKNKADSKDEAQLKNQLVAAVYTHIRRTARFLSIPIIVASQTQNEGDLDIPIKMFHLRLASNTNEAMSRIIAGNKRLTDLSFTKGKFFLKTDKEEHIIRLPIINKT